MEQDGLSFCLILHVIYKWGGSSCASHFNVAEMGKLMSYRLVA